MKILSVLVFVCSLVFCSSCTTVKKEFPPESFLVSGKMNPVAGSKSLKTADCWVLEAGSDIRNLKYYQIMGDKELVNRLHEEDMKVTIRVLNRPDVPPVCNVGSMVEVLDIVEARSKTN